MTNKIKNAFQYIKIRIHELSLCASEYSRGSKLKGEAFQNFTDSRMLVNAHSVEKGLGLKNVQPGHSGKVVNWLLDKLLSFSKDKDRILGFPFRETYRIVIAYMDFQEQFDTTAFKMYPTLKKKYDTLSRNVGESYVESLREKLSAGSHYYKKDDMIPSPDFNFDKFVSSRHSIRTYEQKALNIEDVKKAIEIASHSPSACNRQASYVYFCNTTETVAKIDEMITGSSGFKGEVPNYLIVTTDRAYFSDVEQFQWYINGGLYLSYLSLALHSQGIGHCIMQWKAFYKTEDALKNLMGISKSEAIIAVVGCGYYPDEVRCIDAQRKGVEDTLRIVQ